MKNVALLIIVAAVLIGAVFAGGVYYGSRHEAPPQPVAAAPTSQPSTPAVNHPAPPPLMASNEFQRYRSARQEALQTNPSLQSDYQDILKSMDAQQTKLDAAMIKTNPNLAPVIAKLVALRKQHSGHGTPTSLTVGKPSTPPVVANLTPEEWQEVRAARNDAIQSNAELIAAAKKLADRMATFESQLDAAMIKAHPDIAPIIAKFEAGRQAQRVLANAAPGKPAHS